MPLERCGICRRELDGDQCEVFVPKHGKPVVCCLPAPFERAMGLHSSCQAAARAHVVGRYSCPMRRRDAMRVLPDW